MFRSIQDLVEKTLAMVADHPFSCGFLVGLIAAFAILVFLLLLCVVFRPRRLRCLVIPSEGGELRISAKAVQDSIRMLAANFPAFDVRRIGMYGKPTEVNICIEMDFNGGDEPVSALAAQFRAAVARLATETFGMEQPAQIQLEILRSRAEVPVVSAGAESEDSASGAPLVETSDSGSGQSC